VLYHKISRNVFWFYLLHLRFLWRNLIARSFVATRAHVTKLVVYLICRSEGFGVEGFQNFLHNQYEPTFSERKSIGKINKLWRQRPISWRFLQTGFQRGHRQTRHPPSLSLQLISHPQTPCAPLPLPPALSFVCLQQWWWCSKLVLRKIFSSCFHVIFVPVFGWKSSKNLVTCF